MEPLQPLPLKQVVPEDHVVYSQQPSDPSPMDIDTELLVNTPMECADIDVIMEDAPPLVLLPWVPFFHPGSNSTKTQTGKAGKKKKAKKH